MLLGAAALATGVQGKDWGGVPPHGHVMLVRAQIAEGSLLFDRCVEFAAGEALPNAAHHLSVHTGAAGGSPFVQGALWNAGNIVVPLSPYVPFDWTGCESFTSGMPVP
jgi:hypothetical protein